jgi:hypothetical protein
MAVTPILTTAVLTPPRTTVECTTKFVLV